VPNVTKPPGLHEVLRVSGQQLDDEPFYIAVVIARAYDRLSRARG